MYLTALRAIVLTLALGPTAILLCSPRCDTQRVAAVVCHDEDASPSLRLTGSDACNSMVPDVAASLPEEVRRGVSASGGADALPVAPYQPASANSGTRLRNAAAGQSPFCSRHLSLVLRI